MNCLVSGRLIFKAETEYGVPLQTIMDLAREKQFCFNLAGYSRAAFEAGWTPERIRQRLSMLTSEVDWVMALTYGTVTPKLDCKQEKELWEND